MQTVPIIKEEVSPGVFSDRPDFDKLKDKKIITENFGTLSTGTEILFFESQQEKEDYSIKYLPDPNVKPEEPVNLTKEEQIKLRALLAAQEASQIETKI